MIQRRIDLMKILPNNPVIAEIGVAEGRFSNELLQAGAGFLYMVDFWGHIPGVTGDGNFQQEWHDKNYEMAAAVVSKSGAKYSEYRSEFFCHVKNQRAMMLKGMSHEVASSVQKETLDMLYLDGAHYKKGVLADLEAWYPNVKPGGIVAGHDYLCPDYDVKEAVHEFISKHGISVSVNIIPETSINDAGFYFIKPAL